MHTLPRSRSSSHARSSASPVVSCSPSPRTKRLRREREERELEMSRNTDAVRNRDRDRDTRDRDRKRDREKEADRARSRDKDHRRDRGASREQDRPRDRGEQERPRDRGEQERPRDRGEQERSRDRGEQERQRDKGEQGRPRDRGTRGEQERPRDRGELQRLRDRGEWDRPRERRGRSRDLDRSRERRGRDRSPETSPVRSPVRSRRDRSLSPKGVRQRHQHSPSRTSPRHDRGSKHDQRTIIGVPAAARNENGSDTGRERKRGESSPQQHDAVARMKETEAALEAKETNKEKPSFEYSGKLAAETNKVKGVTLQFTEPPEARKPSTRWRLYVFKDGEPLNDPLYIHRQTCYLFGRERRVADIPTDHPSCSKQHAVIQYRFTEKEEADGSSSSKVRPYVMDLGSTNGTFLNGERLEPQCYYEMFEKDTIKFGNSSREYVFLHEHSIG